MTILSRYRVMGHLKAYALHIQVPFLSLMFSEWTIMIQLVIYGISNSTFLLFSNYFFNILLRLEYSALLKHKPCARRGMNSQVSLLKCLPTKFISFEILQRCFQVL